VPMLWTDTAFQTNEKEGDRYSAACSLKRLYGQQCYASYVFLQQLGSVRNYLQTNLGQN